MNRNFPVLTPSMCPPIKALVGNNKSDFISQDELKSKFDYFGSLVALGNIHLTNTEQNNRQSIHLAAIKKLKNVTNIVQTAGPVFSALSGTVSNDGTTLDALSLLEGQGISLLSIANPQVSSLVSTNSVKSMVTTLEAAGFHWLGLNVKCHHTAVVGGQRVGFIAMCAGHGQCTQLSGVPFAPVKYSSKVITSMVNNVKEYGVEVIVVLLSWGRDSGTYPDETVLAAARKVAQLGVNLIVGYGPNAVQDHAYFENTLVIFSMGNLMSFESNTPYCWMKQSKEWIFDDSLDHCKIVHPLARQNLLERETHTRVYKIYLSRSQPAVAEYITLPMTLDSDPKSITFELRTPVVTNKDWTTVCGHSDRNCLSCKPF